MEGKGFSFPLAVDPTTGRFKTTKSIEEDIREAIYVIVMTSPGERVVNEDYGCGISKYVFHEINADLISRVEQEIYANITRWEPRVDNVEVKVDMEASKTEKLIINITYTVLKTGIPDGIKMPLDMMEGG